MVEENTNKPEKEVTPQGPVPPAAAQPTKGSFWKGFLVGGVVGGIVTPILLGFLLLMICLR